MVGPLTNPLKNLLDQSDFIKIRPPRDPHYKLGRAHGEVSQFGSQISTADGGLVGDLDGVRFDGEGPKLDEIIGLTSLDPNWSVVFGLVAIFEVK